MSKGFDTTGQILLITGVGGSLGAVIAATDLEGVLGGLFSAEAGAPVIVSILLAWLIAAVLRYCPFSSPGGQKPPPDTRQVARAAKGS
ncbi:GntT/GntP/DsdX family permease [Nocardioides sp. AX2bis]|uniref:GntT/GntP/DsdX family permease n=1 Tax=Nocardioides sp. AX2bis TaxID=2653157 RepID=UPI003FA5E22E